MKFECIKGMADSDNVIVIVMQGDVVAIKKINDGVVCVVGVAGWCKGFELSFSPKHFVEHFKVIEIHK